jgi:SAM-dependent methyltransferase
MIYIISGPTSAGKSTFMASERAAELTGLPAETPVVFPSAHSAELDQHSGTDVYFHYNLLRTIQANVRQVARSMMGGVELDPTAFDQDMAWTDLLKLPAPKSAVVLVASKQTLFARIRQRSIVEEPNLTGRGTKIYSNDKWVNRLEGVDLLALYKAWCRELRDNDIPYVLLDSNDEGYPVIQDEERLEDIVNYANSPSASANPSSAAATGDESAFSRDAIVELLRERRFGYHRIELPYGLHTRGQDRSETRDLVLPKSLVGKTVLDVGSAHGYFCYEAEARGAARVVGAEISEERFRDALLLKEIKGSKVEFIQRDIVRNPLDEQFDYVLLLNVLHHLTEPIRALRQLASITREQLVIEFPTLADRKFQETLDTELPRDYDTFPLVGVSSMREGVGQTFVFTPSAIQRILVDHESLFEDVEILESPMHGRAIALCHKRSPETGIASDRSLREEQPKYISREERRRRRKARRGEDNA